MQSTLIVTNTWRKYDAKHICQYLKCFYIFYCWELGQQSVLTLGNFICTVVHSWRKNCCSSSFYIKMQRQNKRLNFLGNWICDFKQHPTRSHHVVSDPWLFNRLEIGCVDLALSGWLPVSTKIFCGLTHWYLTSQLTPWNLTLTDQHFPWWGVELSCRYMETWRVSLAGGLHAS